MCIFWVILKKSSTENQSLWGSSSLVKTVRIHQVSWMERGWMCAATSPVPGPLCMCSTLCERGRKQGGRWGQSCCVERLEGVSAFARPFFRLQLPQLKSGFGLGSFLEYQNLAKDGLDEGATNSDWLSAIGAGWRKLSRTHRHTCVYIISIQICMQLLYTTAILSCYTTIFAHVPSSNMLFSTYFHVLSACESSYVFKYMWSDGGSLAPQFRICLPWSQFKGTTNLPTMRFDGPLGVPMQLGPWLWHSFSNNLGTHQRLGWLPRLPRLKGDWRWRKFLFFGGGPSG